MSMLTSATATWIATMAMKAIAIVHERRRLDKAVLAGVPFGTLWAVGGRKLSGQPGSSSTTAQGRPAGESAGDANSGLARSGTGFNRPDMRWVLDSRDQKCIKTLQIRIEAPCRCINPA
jgi:hypothetical protein